MAKLGQLLVTRGWITVQQLTRALKNQQTVGGRLGTCLLEMEAIAEDMLLKGLSEQLGTPPAAIDDLRSVSEDVLAALPAKVARRCHAVPFRLAGGRLDVAMLQPHDLTAQDELAFASGKRIKVHVLHEVRIYEALDRYYGEESPSRFSHVLDRLNRTRYLWERDAERAAQPPAPLPTPPGGILAAVPKPAAKPLGVSPAPPASRRRPAPLPAAASTSLEAAPAAALSGSATPAAAQPAAAPPARRPASPRSVALTAEERAALGASLSAAAAPAPPAPAVETVAELEAAFATATDRDEVARLLVAHLARGHGRTALFQVGRDRISGWMAQGPGIDLERFMAFSVGFDQPSIFLNLRQGSGLHLGPLPPMPAHRTLAACWGGDLPRECLLLPVRLRDRLVTVVYLDRGGAPLGRVDLPGMQRLVTAAASAFERCILAKKRARPAAPPGGRGTA